VRAVVVALLLVPSLAMADVISPAPDAVQVTIYRSPDVSTRELFDSGGGLALITETRTVEIPAGTSKVVFLGVADAIVPQTAGIDGLPALILESNFDYDLLTPGAIIAKSHGERVTVVRIDPATGREVEREATIRTGPNGVVLEVDGRAEALNCSGLAEKLIFPRVPAGLADEAKLSMTVRAEQAGRHTVQLSYLALGLDWSADYVATINPDGRTLDLVGWVTLVNRASTTFANAPAEVVAGELSRNEEETQPPGATTYPQQPACWPIGSFIAPPRRMPERLDRILSRSSSVMNSPMAVMLQEAVVTGSRIQAEMRELGDYKLYALPEPTTIAARQSKQVRFLTQDEVPFTRLYVLRVDESELAENDFEPQRPVVTLRLQNEKSDGLGKPLPAGIISVMEDSTPGAAVLAGEHELNDTPVGLPLDLELGQAMDVWIEPRVTAERTIEREDFNEQHADIEVRLGNDKPVPIVIEYRHPADSDGFRVVSESRKHTLKYGDPQWTFRLRPGGRASLRYSIRRTD
jgi:hypothetical protein